MRLEEIQCSGCRVQTEDVQEESRSRSISPSEKMVIVQCLDCDHHYCADCLLGHQIDTNKSSHRIVSLPSSVSLTQETGKDQEAEINNNEIMYVKYPKKDESKRESEEVGTDNTAEIDEPEAAASAMAHGKLVNEQEQQANELFSIRSIEALRQLIEMKQHQQQQQQQQLPSQQSVSNTTNPRLLQIEAEINKTFAFYEQTLRERKEYLLKEMNTITQYALLSHSQNLGKQLQVQYQLDMKKQTVEKELQMDYEMYGQYGKQIEQLRQELGENNEEENAVINSSISVLNEMVAKIEVDVKGKLSALKDLNQLLAINNQLIEKCKATDPLASVEFISNYSAIQTSIRNTFGYIRINQQQQQQQQQSQPQQLFSSKPSFPQKELSVICDMKMLKKSNETSSGPFSSVSSTASSLVSSDSAVIQSPISYMRKASSSSIVDRTTQPVDDEANQSDETAALVDTIKNVLSNNFGAEAVAQYLNSLQQQQMINVNDSTASDAINQSIVQNEMASAANENLVQLSAGSTASNKSTKSNASSSSLKSSVSTSSATSTALAATQSKHPLSHLYANFINSNPKLNTFNYLVNDVEPAESQSISHHPKLGSSRYSSSSIGSSYGGSKTHLSSSSLMATASASASSMSSPSMTMLSTGKHHGGSAHQLQLNRSKMIYHCKFGEFGINDGQFTEPSGVTINTNNDIIVADTNSHRIQIFDKDGNFKFKFGECGKRDGQLLYPNRVSIVKQTGDIVVTERSPTHQIQIYNKYGQFIRKFGANILQHPRGVYVDYKARIVVVECKVMRVIIFDLYGNVLNKFNCSKYLEFPNGVCCSNPTNPGSNQREEIYISDNRAHCIKVFDYNGNFLRQIGAEGITNYPIGVGINANNEILVADNHNNFNLTVFTQEGKLINALESKVKHAQCFDVGLMDDGSIVLASKDYRIYVYKYTNTLDYMTEQPTSVTTQQAQGGVFSPTSSTSSNSSSSSSVSSSSNPFYSNAGASAFTYDLFAEGNNKLLFPGDSSTNFNSSNSMFNILSNSGANTNSVTDQLINEADLVPFFGSSVNFESSDLGIEDKSSTNGSQATNLNNSNLNQSFSNLFGLSGNKNSCSNTNNLVSMLNGFL